MAMTAAKKQAADRARKAAEDLIEEQETEQELRAKYGYAESESRTKAERDAAAARICPPREP